MATQNLGGGQGVGEIGPYLQYSLQSGTYLSYQPQQQLGPSVAAQRQSAQFPCSDPFRQSLCVPSLVVPAPLPSECFLPAVFCLYCIFWTTVSAASSELLFLLYLLNYCIF